MNPYLEALDVWRGFHLLLASEIVRALNPIIGPRYFAYVEVRTVFEEGIVTMSSSDAYPDAAVLELTPPPPSSTQPAVTMAIPA